jgi:hypothetical protein
MQELVLWIEPNDSVSYLIITSEFCSVSSIKRSVTLVFISSAWMSNRMRCNKPLFSPHNVTVNEKVALEINFWIPVEKKLGLGVCFDQITFVRCHSAVQWPYVFTVGQWSMNWRPIMPCAYQSAINSEFCTDCESALHIQYSYQTLHLAVATSVDDWSSARARTHTNSLSLSLCLYKSNIRQLTGEYEKGQNQSITQHEWHNKYNRRDTRVKEYNTIPFTSLKQ